MAFDLAFTYDAQARRADLAWGGRDLVLSASLATPAILALLCDRRARPDDPLPMEPAPLLAPEGLNPRRGWCGDALLRTGRLGSRLWLLERAKRTEVTRRRAEAYALEALAGLPDPEVEAEWQGDRLALRCRLGRELVELDVAVT